MAYSVVVDGEFLLEWCEYFGQPQVWYITDVPQPAMVRQLCSCLALCKIGYGHHTTANVFE